MFSVPFAPCSVWAEADDWYSKLKADGLGADEAADAAAAGAAAVGGETKDDEAFIEKTASMQKAQKDCPQWAIGSGLS